MRPRHKGYIDFQYGVGALITQCLRTKGDHNALLREMNAFYLQTARN